MRARFWLALALAFSPLLLAQPAYAWDTTSGNLTDGAVQFDFRGGTATQVLQVAEGSTLTITVNNTIANCIGNCIPRPDTWSLTINGERWDGNSIDIVTIQTIVSGSVTITATGKDEGFWAGWYGPIFSAPIVTAPAPVETGTWEGQQFTATAPAGEVFTAVTGWYGAPTDPSCGADVSSVLATLLGGSTFTVGADNGVFGDPCGGVVKVLRVQLTSSAGNLPTPAPTELPPVTEPTPLPSPTATPQPEPSPSQDTTEPVIPVVPPVVEPPVIEPAPQPQPIPFPTTPDPEPAPAPIEPSPTPTDTAEPEQTEAPQVPDPQQTEPTIPDPEPTIEASEPEPEQTSQPEPSIIPVSPEPPVVETVEEHSTTVIDEIAELEPSSLSDAQLTQLEAAAEAVFAVAEQGSPAYEKALEALAIIAEADDVELPAELAAIPLIGNAAAAVLDAFNNLGITGADMAPAQREKAEETVVAAVVVGQVAQMATAAAASAGVSAAASTRKIK